MGTNLMNAVRFYFAAAVSSTRQAFYNAPSMTSSGDVENAPDDAARSTEFLRDDKNYTVVRAANARVSRQHHAQRARKCSGYVAQHNIAIYSHAAHTCTSSHNPRV